VKVEVHGLSSNQAIRRFVELPKLFELLISGRIFFPTLDTLKSVDPFECGISLAHTIRKMRRPELESEASFLHRFLPQSHRTGDSVEDQKRHETLLKRSKIAAVRQHVTEMRLIMLRSRVVCNCWHLSEQESDAMWKIYGSGIGVMIVSTVKRLRAAIKGAYSGIFCSPNPQEYTIAPVRYVDEKNVSRLSDFYSQRPWLLKRMSFAHEQEIRVSHELPWMIIDPESPGMLIEIDSQKLISEIILSPFNPPWADRPVASAIKIILESRGIAVPIRRSDHMRPPAPQSPVLDTLEFLRLRDLMGGGRRLRMQAPQDLKSLTMGTKAVKHERKYH
jgi:hypothetical protein